MEDSEGPPAPPSDAPTTSQPQLWRVKLYQLNGTGEWDDLGTGHISLCTAPSDVTTLTLQKTSSEGDSEADAQPDAVEIEVKADVVYQRQGDNIITWFEQGSDGGEGGDLALSFQDNDGCREVWKGIFEAQKLAQEKREKDGSADSKRRKLNPDSGGDMSDHAGHKKDGIMERSMHQRMQNQPDPQYNLPSPLPENLGKIKDVLVEGKTEPHFNQRQTMNGIIQSLNTNNFQYINDLLALGENITVKENQPLTNHLAVIMKCIVCMNDMSILEHLVIEATPFMMLCEILSLTSMIKAITHKMPLPVTPALLKEIHKYYRLTFLRDNVMGSVEDGGGGVGSLLIFMSCEVVKSAVEENSWDDSVKILHDDAAYLKEHASAPSSSSSSPTTSNSPHHHPHPPTTYPAFNDERTPPLLNSPSPSSSPPPSPWIPVISSSEDSVPAKTSRLLVNLDYLLGFFTLLRPLQLAIKEEIFKNIGSTSASPNIFSAIAHCLTLQIADLNTLHTIHAKTLTILTNLLQYEPEVVRNVATEGMKRDEPDMCITSALGRFFATGTNVEVMFSVTEALKLLLDSETLEPQTSASAFLGPFFLKLMPLLTLPLTPSSTSNAASTEVCLPFTLELLNFAARNNVEHIKFWVSKGRGIGPMLDKIHKVQTHVKLAILRLIRTLLSLSDPPISQLISLDFFSKIIPLFSPTSDNLVGSCIIEMVDFIKTEKRFKSLVTYLIEGWGPQFEEWGAKTVTFQELKTQHEKNLEEPEEALSMVEQLNARAALNSKFAADKSGAEQLEDHRKFQDVRSEESYFNDSDDDEAPSGSNHNGGSYFSSADPSNPGVKQATTGDNNSGSGRGVGDDEDDNDDDEGFEARLRLHALTAASSITDTVNKNQKPATSMKNGKPLLKNLLPYDSDSDSD
ncbi:hypothetical protein TrVE_jg9792 [Triparma verrucosa]|uniref:Serine/threonine-protein phosphatase 4 regulatory subunit 3-like central domain-containing protein n=1 Tax=Triparma verrucosa TaxID=1606542 RepID=A0A9W7B6G6_9STRA|nr:hypothetical protein TrVE_jg9792 [Triparma verrucosa]